MGNPKDITQCLSIVKPKYNKQIRVCNRFLYITYIIFGILLLSQLYFCFVL